MNAILCAVLLIPLAGPGCDRADGSVGRGMPAARVNGAEILLQGTAAAPGNPQLAAQALEKVIERELLVQRALEAGLEDDPEVARALEAARRETLARAWLERVAADAGATDAEVAAFYAENPALFGERKIYEYREVTVSGAADRLEALAAQAASAKDLETLAGALRWRNAHAGAVRLVRQPAEDLPLSHLPRLSGMREGEIAVLPSPAGAAIVQLVRTQPAPLSPAEAAPLIARFLAGRKRLEVAAAEVQRLRAQARIEYLGPFRK